MSAQKNLFGTVRMGLKCLQHGKMHTFFSVCCYFSFQIPLKHFSPNQFIPKNFFISLAFFTLFVFRWTSTVEIFFLLYFVTVDFEQIERFFITNSSNNHDDDDDRDKKLNIKKNKIYLI